MTGGEAANSSIVLSKLGAKIKIDGNWLGRDENGAMTRAFLKSYKIDCSRLKLKKGYHGVNENVFTDGESRTNFGTYQHLLFTEKQWNTPRKEDIASVKIACIDSFFSEESQTAARYCRELGVPYVTVDVKYDDPISMNADAVIIAGEFRKEKYRDYKIEDLFKEYHERTKGLVIFTCGADDIIYAEKSGPVRTFKPYTIQPLDATGAGDSFRSGIIYSLLKKWPMEKSIHFASALAALICLSFPGVINAPSLENVLDFIRQNKREF